LFARVHGNERCTHQFADSVWISSEPASEITASRLLDLDDFSTHERKLITAKRTGQDISDVQNANAGKWKSHGRP
jgi:hypothetical protein